MTQDELATKQQKQSHIEKTKSKQNQTKHPEVHNQTHKIVVAPFNAVPNDAAVRILSTE
jgi:hypothetical protein